MRGLSPVAVSGGHSSSRCTGLSLSWPLPLWSTGSRRAGSVAVVHGPSCSVACGILPDQGWNPCPLHWQADSQPLRHQGSPSFFLLGAPTHTKSSFYFGFNEMPYCRHGIWLLEWLPRGLIMQLWSSGKTSPCVANHDRKWELVGISRWISSPFFPPWTE